METIEIAKCLIRVNKTIRKVFLCFQLIMLRIKLATHTHKKKTIQIISMFILSFFRELIQLIQNYDFNCFSFMLLYRVFVQRFHTFRLRSLSSFLVRRAWSNKKREKKNGRRAKSGARCLSPRFRAVIFTLRRFFSLHPGKTKKSRGTGVLHIWFSLPSCNMGSLRHVGAQKMSCTKVSWVSDAIQVSLVYPPLDMTVNEI